MADDQLAGVVSADDIPAAAIINRRSWKNAINRIRFRVVKAPEVKLRVVPPDQHSMGQVRVTTAQEWSDFSRWVEGETYNYGRWRHEVSELGEVKDFLRYSDAKVSLSAWMRANRPVFWQAVQGARRNSHMGEALDYMGGNISLGENQINNDVKDLYTRWCLRTVSGRGLRRQRIASYYQRVRPACVEYFRSLPVYSYCFGRV
jgi:hypothetical protein